MIQLGDPSRSVELVTRVQEEGHGKRDDETSKSAQRARNHTRVAHPHRKQDGAPRDENTGGAVGNAAIEHDIDSHHRKVGNKPEPFLF